MDLSRGRAQLRALINRKLLGVRSGWVRWMSTQRNLRQRVQTALDTALLKPQAANQSACKKAALSDPEGM